MTEMAPESLRRRLFELAPEFLCVANGRGVVLRANPASHALLGRTPAQLCGERISSLVVDEDRPGADRLFQSLSATSPARSEVLRVLLPAGVIRRVRWSVRRDAETGLRFAVAWDVTEKQHAQALYRATAQASPTPLVMADAEGDIVFVNQAAQKLVGFTEAELLGSSVDTLVPQEHREAHSRKRLAFLERPAVRTMGAGRDLSVCRRDGTLVPVEVGLSPVSLDGRVHTVISLVDLTERHRANQEIQALARELESANEALQQLAVTDELTGLWNRRKFFQESHRLIKLMQQTGGPFSLILVDVDDFKAFNDRFGHLVGDEALRRVGEALERTRSGSDFAARYGGEEFVLGLPGTDARAAQALAERLRATIAATAWEGRMVSISAGVATLRWAGERGTPTEPLLRALIDAADKALYRSKAMGKNRVTVGVSPGTEWPHLSP